MRAPLRSTEPVTSGSRARITGLPARLRLHRLEPAVDPLQQLGVATLDAGEPLEDDPLVHGDDQRHPRVEREWTVVEPVTVERLRDRVAHRVAPRSEDPGDARLEFG